MRCAIVSAFIIILSMSISMVGLSNIIKYGYGYCGYLGIVVVVIPFLTVGVYKNRKYLKEHNVDTAAVFATDGTRDSGVYERVLSRAGIRVVYPSEENQKLLMSLIYDYVKAGREITDKAQVQKLVDEARALGAQKMILGCTELPIAFEQVNLHQDTVDPTTILAQHAVQAVGAKVKASLLQ